MKKRILAMVLGLCMTGAQAVAAESAEPVKSISCTVDTSRDVIYITGQISNANGRNEVTLLVGEDAYHALYLNQTTSDSNGAFAFAFQLPPDLPSGNYPYSVGSNSGAALFQSTFMYEGKKEYKTFVDANFEIEINGYVPTVSGTISCPENASAVYRVINVTDNTTVAEDTVAATDGTVAVQFTLPSLLNSKTYTLALSFVDGSVTLGGMNITLKTASWKVDIDGTITVQNGAKLQAHVKSLNSGLIDKTAEITAKKEIHTAVPNVIASTRYQLSMQGYAYLAASVPELGDAEYTITGNANDQAVIVATASNIRDFSGRTFVLQYQPTQIRPVSVFGFCADNAVGTGSRGDVTVLRCEDGEIEFSVARDIPAGQSWSGALNVFKFQFQDGHSGESKVQLRDVR